MATKELISTVTVGAGGAASIDFTSIPQTYTDLQIVFSGRASDGYPDTGVSVTFNGLSTNRSRKTLYGTGTSATSSSGTDIAFFTNASTATASTFSSASIYIPNYAGSANKSVSIDGVNEQNNAYALAGIANGLWSSTAAITQVSLAPATATNWLQYTSASLYGFTKGSDGVTTVA